MVHGGVELAMVHGAATANQAQGEPQHSAAVLVPAVTIPRQVFAAPKSMHNSDEALSWCACRVALSPLKEQ